jgi:DNA polymerase
LFEQRCLKARHMLPERTFIACDAIKRLWRTAHPEISSYWKELENMVRAAIENPGERFTARRLVIRRDGAWLRIRLPSDRYLCYPNPGIDVKVTLPSGATKTFAGLSYMGMSQYTKKWERIGTYGGKLFENITQAAACDQLLECGPAIEAAGFENVLSVHDEYVTETPVDRDDLNSDRLGELMCADLGWNDGLPLAAAGYDAQRYKKD